MSKACCACGPLLSADVEQQVQDGPASIANPLQRARNMSRHQMHGQQLQRTSRNQD